jgi:hypothetical protein
MKDGVGDTVGKTETIGAQADNMRIVLTKKNL